MSDAPLSPEEVAHRGFGTAFRGFDTNEVRGYLQRVANELRASTARERDLHRRLAEAEHRAAHPVIEGEALTRILGDEMGRILASAQAAANELRTRAEENAARILREAHEQAQHIRGQAEVILADRADEAEAEAARIRQAAADEAAALAERSRQQATAAVAEVETRARQLVHDAQAARARVLGDLTRRRHLLHAQVEQLRAGRARLLDAYRVVRRTLDEVADELGRVEAEAREAAGAAGERLAAEIHVTVPEADELAEILAAFPEDAELDAHEGAAGPEPGAAEPEDATVELEPPGAGEAPAGEGPPGEAPAEAPPAADPRPRPAAPPRTGVRGTPSLRIVPRPPDPAESPELDVVEAPSEVEGVRVIGPDQAPAAPAPAAPAPAPAAGVGETPPPPAPPAGDSVGDDAAAGASPKVDELFARIRAARADAVARAQTVLDVEPGGEPVESTATPRLPEPAPVPPGPAAEAAREGVLERRDAAVEGIEARLARKLKRALQDEQNEVLDGLRSARGAMAAGILPSPDQHSLRYRMAAAEPLGAAATAGVAFVSGPDGLQPDIGDVVAELAASLAEPLRRALERALGADTADDVPAVVERIGAVYRECKGQRIEGLAGDAVTAAFSLGALAGMAPGSASRWVVDDEGRPCPDCDDNALAGPTPSGDTFPTGQTHPPAHAGCRCVIAPAEVAATVAGG